MLRIGVLADDCSGALASAVALRTGGLRTRVVWNHDDSSEAEALVVDMRTRDRGQEPAIRAAATAGWLVEQGCERLELRIDSTLRGEPEAELRGLLVGSELDEAMVVAVPAFPSAGRITSGGHQRVASGPDGRPFERAVGPRLFGSERYATIPIETVEAGAPALAERLRQERRGGVRRIVIDGENDAHLRIAADAVGVIDGDGPLVTVSPGAWLRWHPRAARASDDGVVVVVVSSPTPQNAEQLACLEHDRTTTVFDAGSAGTVGVIPNDARTIVVETVRAGSEVAANHLAEAAAGTTLEVLESLRVAGRPVAGVVATGGHTAANVLDALRPEALVPDREPAPLCSSGTLEGGPWSGLRLVTKGGIVGNHSTLANLVSTLQTVN